MMVVSPKVGIIDVVRITRHFGVNSGDTLSRNLRWNVTHLPSGYAVLIAIPFCDAVEQAMAMETCGVDWDFFTTPSREHIAAGLAVRNAYLEKSA